MWSPLTLSDVIVPDHLFQIVSGAICASGWRTEIREKPNVHALYLKKQLPTGQNKRIQPT
jgi:hypothetical protein